MGEESVKPKKFFDFLNEDFVERVRQFGIIPGVCALAFIVVLASEYWEGISVNVNYATSGGDSVACAPVIEQEKLRKRLVVTDTFFGPRYDFSNPDFQSHPNDVCFPVVSE